MNKDWVTTPEQIRADAFHEVAEWLANSELYRYGNPFARELVESLKQGKGQKGEKGVMDAMFPFRVSGLSIKVPALPPAACSPNFRGHWSKRNKASQQFKRDVHYAALDWKSSLSKDETDNLPLDQAVIDLAFTVKENRIRDLDNWLARMKPGIDALVDAGIIAKDDHEHLRYGKIFFEVDSVKSPLTVITLMETDLKIILKREEVLACVLALDKEKGDWAKSALATLNKVLGFK